MYTGKLSLTNPTGIPFALSNEFDNVFILREETSECTTAEEFCKTANKNHRYKTKWIIAKDNEKYTRLESKDGCGNIHYLIAYK